MALNVALLSQPYLASGNSLKMGVRNIIILPTVNVSEMWTWNVAQQSRTPSVEITYTRGSCEVSRWDGESNKGVYENLGVGVTTIGVGCGVAEWVKPGTLRWFGHVMRMNEDNFVKRA